MIEVEVNHWTIGDEVEVDKEMDKMADKDLRDKGNGSIDGYGYSERHQGLQWMAWMKMDKDGWKLMTVNDHWPLTMGENGWLLMKWTKQIDDVDENGCRWMKMKMD